jgi:CHASE2 domain-containing sensor protein
MTAAASTDTSRPLKFPTFSLLVLIGCVAAAVALLFPVVREHIDRTEYWTADWRTVLLADRIADKHPGLTVVLFDPATFNGGVVSPIPRDTHASVLRALAAMHPKAIGLDFYFVASQGTGKDAAMLKALREIDVPIVLGAIDEHTSEFSERQKAYQTEFLAKAGRPAGYLALRYDPGHIVRRTSPPLPGSPFQESFARQVALAAGQKLGGPGASSNSMRIAWLIGPGLDTQPFYTVSAGALLPGADPGALAELKKRVEGNIVLTGIDMPNSDRHDTALSVWTDDKMLGVLVHAHILGQLLDGRYFYELQGRERLTFLLTVALVGLTLGWVVRGRRASFVNLSVATAILVAVDATCYYGLRTVLPFTLTLFVWFLGVLAGQHLRSLAQWAHARTAA